MRRSAVIASFLSLAFCVAVVSQTVSAAAPKKSTRPATKAKRRQARAALRGNLKTVSRRMNSVRAQLKQAKRSEADIAQDLVAIRGRLQATRERLAESKARLAAARREQAKVAQALKSSQARLEKQEMQLATRMAANSVRDRSGTHPYCWVHGRWARW